MNIEQNRAAFERFMSDDGKFPQAIDRNSNGDYVLMQAAFSWYVWQTAIELDRQGRGEPVAWADFAGYLIDNFEGHEITEERLQLALAGMLEQTPQPADPVVNESLIVAEPVKEPSGADVAKLADRWAVSSDGRGIKAHANIMGFVRDVLASYGNQENKNG